jgi:hypothetical protein
MPTRMDMLQLMSRIPPDRLGRMINQMALGPRNQGVYTKQQPGLLSRGPIVSLGPGRATIK